MTRLLIGLGLMVTLLSAPALAQRQGGATPGQFDFYVLSLSWSPSFCESRGERAPRMQCGDKPYAFVVHGLWPQYQKGFPEYCQLPAPELDRRTVNAMLDLMPSPVLVRHEWEKHGTCSGERTARAYFETIRKMRAFVKIPAEFQDVTTYKTVTPAEVEDAFIKANPGLSADMISVQCDERRLQEVRLCIGKDYKFTACPEVDRRACRRDRLVMPPLRLNAANR